VTGHPDVHRDASVQEAASQGQLQADALLWVTYVSDAWGDVLPDEAEDAHHQDYRAPWDEGAEKLAGLAQAFLAQGAVALRRLEQEAQGARALDTQDVVRSAELSSAEAELWVRLESLDALQ